MPIGDRCGPSSPRPMSTLYKNLALRPIQGTGGSTSIANSWMQLRLAAAAAREMLVAAAAAQWNVPASEITVQNGVVEHKPSGKTSRVRRLGRIGGPVAGPTEPDAKGPEGLPSDRVARGAPARHAGQDHRQRRSTRWT